MDILISLKIKEKLEKFSESNSEMNGIEDNEINEYEKLLRHYEAEIRSHIKTEHQMKLFSEAQQSRIEELEKIKEELKAKIKFLSEQISKNKMNSPVDYSDFEQAKNENLSLKNLVKSYEDRNLNIIELEKRLRNQNSKFNSEIKNLDESYKEKIKKLKKKDYSI